MGCECAKNQDTLSGTGVKADGIYHDYHCPYAHAEVTASAPAAAAPETPKPEKVAKKKADAAPKESTTLSFERGSFPLQKPGEITAVIMNGRVFDLAEPVTIAPGEEIVVTGKKPIIIAAAKQGLNKRAKHSLCQTHQGCEVRNDGKHVQINGEPCKKHQRCSVVGPRDEEVHTPWPPVAIMKRHLVK